jgi:hypothetical protein
MTEQSSETANRNAQDAAGPPPGAHALRDSGLVDQPKSSLRKAVDTVVGFLTGRPAAGKQS